MWRLQARILSKPLFAALSPHTAGGIILFERIKSLPASTGALTLWNGAATAEPSQDYFSESAEVSLWETVDPADGKAGHKERGGKGHHSHAHSSHGGAHGPH